MDIQRLIATKRDGGVHTADELCLLAQNVAKIPDYQLSAWLMAAYLNGLNSDETASLTLAMAQSGATLNRDGLPKPWLDKHSTGGVGDKTTLVLLPLLAACGVSVVKMSGRGLGITGGTLDKLESVPGFRTELSPFRLIEQAKKIGIGWTGQTSDLAPADKTLYALRDATGTVESIPLIVASILSKKIASGAEVVMLDVKCGSGAFMPNWEAGRKLAEALKETGEKCGLKMRLALTDMSQPLGRTAGNVLEVKEAFEVLEGNLSGRLGRLCIALAGLALEAGGVSPSMHIGKERARAAILNGAALRKAHEWFEAQGAEGDLSLLPTAPVVQEVVYRGESGFIAAVDARVVGEAVLELGGGRRTKEDVIDPTVGVETFVEVGSLVAKGQMLFKIHSSSDEKAEQVEKMLWEAVKVSPDEVKPPELIFSIL